MRVVVTGGAGFIGTNLCRRLLGSDGVTRVTVLDDFATGSPDNLRGLDVDLVEGSILDEAVMGRLAADADAIVHLAALGSVPRSVADPVSSHRTNATGTVSVLEAARLGGVGHVVVASSSSVYGANPALPKHEGLAQLPMSPYAASKLATEGYALAYQHSYGLPVLAFRFFNVFGPHQAVGHTYAAVVPVFVAAALEGRPIPVHGDGTQSPRLHLRRHRHGGDRGRDRTHGHLPGAGEPRVRHADRPVDADRDARTGGRSGAPP